MIYLLFNILLSSVYFTFNNSLCYSFIVSILFSSLLVNFGSLLLFCQNFKLHWQGWYTFLLAVNFGLAWLADTRASYKLPALLALLIHLMPSPQSYPPITPFPVPAIFDAVCCLMNLPVAFTVHQPSSPNSINQYFPKVSSNKIFAYKREAWLMMDIFFLKYLVTFNREHYFPYRASQGKKSGKEKRKWSHSVVSNSLRPHGL